MLRPQGHPLQAVLSDWGGGLTSPLCPPASEGQSKETEGLVALPIRAGPRRAFFLLEVRGHSSQCPLSPADCRGGR